MTKGWISVLGLIHEWCKAESAFLASVVNGAGLNQHSQPCSWMTQHWITILSLVHEWRNTESPFSASVRNDSGLNRHPQLHSCMVQGWIGMFWHHSWTKTQYLQEPVLVFSFRWCLQFKTRMCGLHGRSLDRCKSQIWVDCLHAWMWMMTLGGICVCECEWWL